jgi:hypothetical protein
MYIQHDLFNFGDVAGCEDLWLVWQQQFLLHSLHMDSSF